MMPLVPMVCRTFVVIFELVLVVPGSGGRALNRSHNREAWGEVLDGEGESEVRGTDGYRWSSVTTGSAPSCCVWGMVSKGEV